MASEEYSFVFKYLYKKKWYNPNYSEEDEQNSNESDQRDPEKASLLAPAKASLLKAWEFYERHILYRYVDETCHEDDVPENSDEKKTKQRPRKVREAGDKYDSPKDGKEDSKLYPVFGTSVDDLDAWGTGIYIYFATLKCVLYIFLVVALLHIPMQIYYASELYNGGQSTDEKIARIGEDNAGTYFLTSAMCTNEEFVLCKDCTVDQWNRDRDSIGNLTTPITSIDGTSTSDSLTFVRKNNCNGPAITSAMFNFASLIIVLAANSAVIYLIERRATKRDEDHTTTEDYTIMISSPPEVTDPNEWADFFAQFEKQGRGVPLVTVALDNEKLLKLLLSRRNCRNDLESMLEGREEKYDLDNEEEFTQLVATLETEKEAKDSSSAVKGFFISMLQDLLGVCMDELAFCKRILLLEEQIENIAQSETFVPSKVFVTMETERGQINALSKLTVGKLVRKGWLRDKRDPEDIILFQNKHYLNLEDCVEPEAIRWQDLSFTLENNKLLTFCRSFQKGVVRFLSFFIVAGLLVAQIFFVRFIRDNYGPTFASFFISFANTAIPKVAKAMILLENHSTEDSYQKSMYGKITLFRWTNTVILPLLITPFTRTLSSGPKDLIKTVMSVILFDALYGPLLLIADPSGFIKKHFLAPRVPTSGNDSGCHDNDEAASIKTQEKLNNLLSGTSFSLGERYTDFTKIMFVCFFYSSIIPSAPYVSLSALLLKYWVDKYMLLRAYARQPPLGESVGNFSFGFLILSFVFYTLGASFLYTGFPFDNLCQIDDEDDPYHDNVFNMLVNQTVGITTKSGIDLNQTITDNSVYKYCDQNLWFKTFKPEPTENTVWMTDAQRVVCETFAGLFSAQCIGEASRAFWMFFSKDIISLFASTYEVGLIHAMFPFYSFVLFDYVFSSKNCLNHTFF